MSVTLMLMRLKQDIKFKPSLEMPNKIFPQIIKKKKKKKKVLWPITFENFLLGKEGGRNIYVYSVQKHRKKEST